MEINRDTYSYSFDEYDRDVKSLGKTFSTIKNLHLIAVYRGSIPLVVHLSNILSCYMSIIRIHDESNKNVTPFCSFSSKDIHEGEHLVVVDDVYDTGRTMQSIQRMLEVEYENHTISYYSLFGRKNDDGVIFLHEKKNKWITFHWERI